MEKQYIPKYLDAQPQILWWEADEFGFFIIFVILGVMFNHQILGVIIGFLLMKAYSKFKNSKQEGYGYHKAYSLGLYQAKGKYPEYWIKRFIR